MTVFLCCRVFSYLDVVSLCRSACVSKYWHQIALDGSNWQRVDLFHYQTCVKVSDFTSSDVLIYMCFISQECSIQQHYIIHACLHYYDNCGSWYLLDTSDGKSQIKSNHDVSQLTTVTDIIVYVRNVINVHLA